MKFADDIIAQAREDSENVEYGTLEGISQESFVTWLNDAQKMAVGVIQRTSPDCSLFDTTDVITTVAHQRAYPLPGSSAYAGTGEPTQYMQALKMVEFSQSGRLDDYYPLDYIHPKLAVPLYSDVASGYYLMGETLVLSPTPSVGGRYVRITYPQRLPDLDIIRATVSSYTVGTRTIAMNTGYSTSFATKRTPFYICICDTTTGKIVQEGLKVTSVSSANLVLSTDTAPAAITASNIIVMGKRAQCVSELMEEAERYLIGYCAWKAMKKDSAVDAEAQGNELSALETDLLQNVQQILKDPVLVQPLEPWLE